VAASAKKAERGLTVKYRELTSRIGGERPLEGREEGRTNPDIYSASQTASPPHLKAHFSACTKQMQERERERERDRESKAQVREETL
jgi:hypothetical protein